MSKDVILLYEKEKKLLAKDSNNFILKLPSVLKNAETFASVSSVYSQILTNEDARLIKSNDGPNRATRKLMNNERLKTLIYNAIVLLEENGYTIEEFKYELGMTQDEYDEIFNEKEGN